MGNEALLINDDRQLTINLKRNMEYSFEKFETKNQQNFRGKNNLSISWYWVFAEDH